MKRFLFVMCAALGLTLGASAQDSDDATPEEAVTTAEAATDDATPEATPEMASDDASMDDQGEGEGEEPVATPEPVTPTLAAPTGVKGKDRPWDHGDGVVLTWTPSEDPGVTQYIVRRSVEENGLFEIAAAVDQPEDLTEPVEVTVDGLSRGEAGYFRVQAIGSDGSVSEEVAIGPIVSQREIFDAVRFSLAIITLILCGAVIYWIRHARSGRDINVRKIAGLEAVDEAVGRATEMGRSVLFIPGIQDMNDIQTIAGINILSRVSKTAAEYDAKIEVPTSRSLVMTTARETVHAAFLGAGRPDAYNEDLIYYVTDEQFGYVAYLQGMMVREKPAACFYMGSFFAESLILAETGNSVGAIQVAGTAQPAQLPFFVAACDYTLIGEEFFAASAYLSGSPEELGSLKGQDVGKVVVAVGLVVGVAVTTLAAMTGSEVLQNIATYIRDVILT